MQKVARAIGVTLDELLHKLSDEKIDIRKSAFNDDEAELVNGYRNLSEEGKRLIKGMIGQLTFIRVQSANRAMAM